MIVSSTRLATFLLAATVCTACAPQKPAASTSGTAGAPTAGAPPAAAGPTNGLVSAAGTPAAPALSPEQRAELNREAAAAPKAQRPTLRYALASGDDGKVHLVIYDGEGLAANGRHPGKPHEYVIFKVLNMTHGEHYDPQQNALIAAIPPPPEREVPEK